MNRIRPISVLHSVFGASRRDHSASRGQSIVEFALIIPIMLVIAGGALDMGRLFYARVSIENAAREGAFYGAANPRCDTAARTLCDDPGTAEWRALNEISGVDGLTVSFACSDGGAPVSITSCQPGHMYTASVSTEFDLVTPLLQPLLGTSMTLDATATAVVISEAFNPNEAPGPLPSPPPLCTVPDMVGMARNPAHDAWIAAGFVQQNLTWPGMSANDIVANQTIPAGWDEPCATAEIVITE